MKRARAGRRRSLFWPLLAASVLVAAGAAAELGYRAWWRAADRRESEAGSFELYAVGGSTASGAPFGIAFTRLVVRMFDGRLLGRPIASRNLAEGGASIYPQELALERRLRYRDRSNPAAVLVYCAENEDFGVPTRKLFLWKALRWAKEHGLHRSWLLTDALMAWERGSGVPRDNPRRGIRDMRHYEFYLRRLIAQARAAGAQPVLSTVAGNLRVEPRHWDAESPALGAWRRARELESRGRLAEARDAYWEAIDLEDRRQRATRGQNDLIRRLGRELDVPVVDAEAEFEKAAPDGIPGPELFSDIMHPSLEGHRLLARAFARTLSRLYAQPFHDASVEELATPDALMEGFVISGTGLVTESDGFEFQTERMRLAEANLRRALARDPRNFSAWLGLALIDGVRGGRMAETRGTGWLFQHGIHGGVFRFCGPRERFDSLIADLGKLGVSPALLAKARLYEDQAVSDECGRGPAFIRQPSRFSSFGVKAR